MSATCADRSKAIPAEDRAGLVREIESHLTDSLAAGPDSLATILSAMRPPHALATLVLRGTGRRLLRTAAL